MPGLLIEKRCFPRVTLAASGLLVYRDGSYSLRVENISLSGALISLQGDDCPCISQGERCSLVLPRGGPGAALRFAARLVHFGFDMASLRFDNLDQDSRLMLRSIIAHQQPESSPARAGSARRRG